MVHPEGSKISIHELHCTNFMKSESKNVRNCMPACSFFFIMPYPRTIQILAKNGARHRSNLRWPKCRGFQPPSKNPYAHYSPSAHSGPLSPICTTLHQLLQWSAVPPKPSSYFSLGFSSSLCFRIPNNMPHLLKHNFPMADAIRTPTKVTKQLEQLK